MTVAQAIARLKEERRQGIDAEAWTLTREEIDQLQDDLIATSFYAADDDDEPVALSPLPPQPGYAMTFMGVNIYRA